jgi:hypothetical protein
MPHSKTIPAVLIGVTLACSGGNEAGSASGNSNAAATARATPTSAADLPDPCGLVTDAEVSDLLWQGMETNQREALQAKNAQHVITKRGETIETPAGRTCYFQYRVVAGNDTRGEGDFRLRTLATETFKLFADARSSKDPIPGVGDQAFYMSNAAYALRGGVGVEVVDFSSKPLEIELLKKAVARLP